MSKHTPGPWMPTLCDDGAWMVNTDGDIIVVGDNLSQADARLIAAAPELLEALRGAIEWMSCVDGPLRDGVPFKRNLESFKAAIAKAEGRS